MSIIEVGLGELSIKKTEEVTYRKVLKSFRETLQKAFAVFLD